MRGRVWAAIAVLALAAASCSSANQSEASDEDVPLEPVEGTQDIGDEESDDETLDEDVYLERVMAIQDVRDEEADALNDLLGQAYQVRDRLWEVAEVIRLRAMTDEALDEATDLNPPGRFRSEHESWVAWMEASGEHLEDAQEALEERDMLGMVVSFVRSNLELPGVVLDWSEDFCRAAVPKVGPGDPGGLAPGPDVLCRREESIPAGPYGEELFQTVLHAEMEVGLRIGPTGFPAFTDEERLAYLNVVQPEVEEILQQAGATVQDLEPPPELADDHELVVRFYEDMLDVARRITAAAEEGDLERFQELAPESYEPGTTLRKRLSERGCAILDGFAFFTNSRGC